MVGSHHVTAEPQSYGRILVFIAEPSLTPSRNSEMEGQLLITRLLFFDKALILQTQHPVFCTNYKDSYMFLAHSFRNLTSSLGYRSKKSWPVCGCSRTLSARIAILADLIISRCLQLIMDVHGCVTVCTARSNPPLPTDVKCYKGEAFVMFALPPRFSLRIMCTLRAVLPFQFTTWLVTALLMWQVFNKLHRVRICG